MSENKYIVRQYNHPIINYISNNPQFDSSQKSFIGSFKSSYFFGVKVKSNIWRVVYINFNLKTPRSTISKIMLGIENQLNIDFLFKGRQLVSFEFVSAAHMLQDCIDTPIAVRLVEDQHSKEAKNLMIKIQEFDIMFMVRLQNMSEDILCNLLSNLQKILFILNKRSEAVDFLFKITECSNRICRIDSRKSLIFLYRFIEAYAEYFPLLNNLQQDLFVRKFSQTKTCTEWKDVLEIMFTFSYKNLRIPGLTVKKPSSLYFPVSIVSFKCCDNLYLNLDKNDLLEPLSLSTIKLILYLELVCGKKLKDNILRQKLKAS